MGRLHFGSTLGALLVGTIVIASGWTDAYRYFGQQLRDPAAFAAHSADATFAGRALADLPPTTRVVMDQRLTGQPTVQFLAPNASKLEGYAPYLLPLTTDTDTAVFLGGDQTTDMDFLRQLYPNAAIKTFSPDGGPVLLQEGLVSASDITAIQGLQATFRPSDGSSPQHMTVGSLEDGGDRVPAAAPFDASFEGALEAPSFGDYVFSVNGPDAFELRIDHQPVAATGQAVHLTLARGIHHLEFTGTVTDASQAVQVLWQPPSSNQPSPIPRSNLFSSAAVEVGLLGKYYANGTWTEPPRFLQVDPFVAEYFQVTPLPLPFSVDWDGQIAAPVDGTYGFDVTSIDTSHVFVDEQETTRDAPLALSAGWHAIRVRFEAHSGSSHVELRWHPPGQDWSIVPATVLLPGAFGASTQPLPQLPARAAPVPGPEAATRASARLTPVWEFAPGSGSQPIGVAVDEADDVYVVDAGNKRFYKLDADGHVVWTAEPPADTAGFAQPTAVGVAADGSALVLDGESGAISRIGPSGAYAGIFAQALSVYHPRGLALGRSGDMYVADTGGSRALHLNVDGTVLGQVGGRDAGAAPLDQPTGVAVTGEGDVILVDPAAKKLFHFAASGALLGSWDVGGGPTVAGPQVAVDGQNTIWVSDTATGRLEAFSLDGTPDGTYAPADGLTNPSGLAVGNGYVVVAEPGAGRIRKFTLP